ncbi:MAG: hypothetical protein ACE5F1_09170 [Planctomycetota bacterium]
MDRRAVNLLLVTHLLIVWMGMLFRIDRFPLSWAPMYSVFEPRDRFKVKVMKRKRIKRGFKVTRRDGSTDRVGVEELNIPFGNMRRLYAQRAFGKGPPKHTQGNAKLGPMNRWIRGLGEDEPNFPRVDWDWRLFLSLNKTLGHEPSSPRFITRIKASIERVELSGEDLSLLKRKKKKAVLAWNDEWQARWR